MINKKQMEEIKKKRNITVKEYYENLYKSKSLDERWLEEGIDRGFSTKRLENKKYKPTK